mmetsp:Transcript_88880/g.251918  ORF Transcript_88880/g.251918 Transcript_88880/m.251918 type:complete len:236 (-) Transcript_88880:224-931(-)
MTSRSLCRRPRCHRARGHRTMSRSWQPSCFGRMRPASRPLPASRAWAPAWELGPLGQTRTTTQARAWDRWTRHRPLPATASLCLAPVPTRQWEATRAAGEVRNCVFGGMRPEQRGARMVLGGLRSLLSVWSAVAMVAEASLLRRGSSECCRWHAAMVSRRFQGSAFFFVAFMGLVWEGYQGALLFLHASQSGLQSCGLWNGRTRTCQFASATDASLGGHLKSSYNFAHETAWRAS